MNSRNQSFIVTFLLIVAVADMVVTAVRNQSSTAQALTINELAQDIQLGKVARVVIENDDSLRVIYKTGTEAETKTGVEAYKETDSTLVAQLTALGVSPEKLSAEQRDIHRADMMRERLREVTRPVY